MMGKKVDGVAVYVRKRGDSWQAFWTDPMTGRRATKVVKAGNRRDAERAADSIGRNLDRGVSPKKITWGEFRDRLDEEYMPSRAKKTREAYSVALNQFENSIGEPPLAAINASVMSKFAASLTARNLTGSTVANYLRHVRSALRWAERMGMIAAAPRVEIPRFVKGPKGRALTGDEVAQFLRAARRLERERGIKGLARLMRGLLHSGMRIGEACALSWTADPVRLDLESGRRPMVVWSGGGQKSRKSESWVVPPDFFRVVRSVPKSQRVGLVFPVVIAGKRIGLDRIGKLISTAGRMSGVETPAGWVGAHDLRRTFGTEWSTRVRPVELKQMMRHRDLSTTMTYYVSDSITDIGDSIWVSCTPKSTPAPASLVDPSRIRIFAG
jgi:integrase